MKTLAIYQREVLERTGFKKWPFKKVSQFVIYYGGKKILSNCHVNIDDEKLKVKFNKIYESRSFIKFNLLLNDLFKRRDNFSKELYRALKVFDIIRAGAENEHKARNQFSDIIFEEFIPMQKENENEKENRL